ncbi:hypothetical protein HY990_05150 [Candidatus Micrarchaeota archaeon]|nr:hypothetical protein [Candidatus Micrarchaeota archaeon]
MWEYIIALLSGAIVKIVDHMEDEGEPNPIITYPLAIIYGATIGYLIGSASFGLLFLAALIAQVFAKKIDRFSHTLGLLTAAIVAFFLSGPQIETVPLIAFILLAFLDEMELKGKFKIFTDYRLFLKIGALAYIVVGRLDYLAGIVIFDLGYEGIKTVIEKSEKKAGRNNGSF